MKKNNYVRDEIIIGLCVIIFLSMFIGALIDSFLVGIFAFGFGCLFILPIFYDIGVSKQAKENIKNNLPHQFEYLDDNGVCVEERYLNDFGSGVIIDRKAKKIAIVQCNNDKNEPVIIPFGFVKKCSYYENKEKRIKGSKSGEVGTILDDDYLKEFGKYEGRDIENIIKEMGIKIVIGLDKKETIRIPYFGGSVNENLLVSRKTEIENIVENINSVIEETESYNMDEIKEMAQKLESDGKKVIKNLEIRQKIKENMKVSESDIEFLIENDSVIDLPDDLRSEMLDYLNDSWNTYKKIIPNDSKDYNELRNSIKKAKKILNKKPYMKSDNAKFSNLGFVIENIMNKYNFLK